MNINQKENSLIPERSQKVTKWMKTLQFHDKGKDGKQRWKYFMIIYEELK